MKNYITAIKFDGHADIDLQLIRINAGWKDVLFVALVNFGKECFKDSNYDPKKAAKETIDSLPDDFEEAKQTAFDQGWEFNVKEVVV